ncbi:hypothetical protein Tco_1181778, partial [Tanacetum coccineum]
MDITRAQQIALDDALVALANRLKIGKSNLRLSSDLKFKEATLQVVYDVLKLIPFYKAFQITADVPEIYMQEFWTTARVHNRSIRFKMNNKKHIVNLEFCKEMLQICPKPPNQTFVEPPFEHEILTFLKDLGHSGEIKVITDVNVNKLHQPWRSFSTVINKCLSGKVETKNAKKGNEMYYPRFTKVIINFFMTKDPSIPRRNKELNLQKQKQELEGINLILIELLKRSLLKLLKEKRIKATAKVTSSRKKKQPAKGLETLSEITLTEAEQMEIVLERSKTQKHISHASGSGADEGTGVKLGVPNVPSYDYEDEEISWKSSDDESDDDASKSKDDQDDTDDDDQDDAGNDSEQTESNNDGDEFVHPKFTTHDEEDKEEDSFDPRVQTPSHYESTDDEAYDDVSQSGNAEEEKMDDEQTNEEEVVLERRDTEMT